MCTVRFSGVVHVNHCHMQPWFMDESTKKLLTCIYASWFCGWEKVNNEKGKLLNHFINDVV